ncbi:hypothetical protein C8P63_11315 [Melghirimyces profundicolus]|uniref:MetS family NSS transporter small subunit n=1 Tax=Melghirimyces profundicolus TaxID=1242148 RepID=A0A2T6BSK7_9BACL|nr:MetS family NSS transporter small subunit [Melghirimyces profundicolus]PTX59070.1 hypothetical protein C8P63_11315 [Melghirimyces profundicolus]
MNPEAVAVLITGATGLWGGLAFFLWHAYRCKRKNQTGSV